MDNLGKLSFFIKLARAGGTTFSKEWIKTPDPDGLPRIVWNSDSLRLAMTGQRFNSKVEGLVSEFKNLFLKTYLLMNYHILVDGTHSSLDSIRKLLKLDRNAQPIVLSTPIDECIRRARVTGQSDLEQPIYRMYNNLFQLWCKYHSTAEYIRCYHSDIEYDLEECFNKQEYGNQSSFETIVDKIRENV